MKQQAPFITAPLSDAAKEKLFSRQVGKNSPYASLRSESDYLDAYVKAFLEENRLKGRVESKKARTSRLIAFAVFALVLLIHLVYRALYHKSLLILVLIAAAAVLVICIKNGSIRKYLTEEVKKRPDDSMDNVLISQISGACRRWPATLIGVGMAAAVLLLCAALFAVPHSIYEKNDMGGYSLRYYTLSLKPEDHVSVPETYNGLPVNEIRGEVFCRMGFRSIDLPSGITEIRGSTFENCANLETIEIPDGVVRIGGHAFYGCSSLSYVRIPSSVREIGSSAFRRCGRLYQIEIPSTAQVNEKAFKESPTRIRFN